MSSYLKNSKMVVYIPAQVAASFDPEKLEREYAFIDQYIDLETVDLDGNPVTSEELFADHDVTVINIWATWCINCKQEMEELGALNKEWADKGCQIIGICDDAVDDAMIASAKTILEEHGVTFPDVVMSQEIREVLVANGLPTTYFVDSEGKILCDPITGKYVEKYVETLEELLSGK